MECFSYRWRSPSTIHLQGLKLGGRIGWPFGEFHGIARNTKPPVARNESVKTKFHKMSLFVILTWYLAAFATTSQQKAAGIEAEMLQHFEPLEEGLMSLIRPW